MSLDFDSESCITLTPPLEEKAALKDQFEKGGDINHEDATEKDLTLIPANGDYILVHSGHLANWGYQVLQALGITGLNVLKWADTYKGSLGDFLLLAIDLDDPNIVKRMLQRGGESQFPAHYYYNEHYTPTESIGGASTVDITAWDWTTYNSLPNDYKYALTQAIRISKRKMMVNRDWDAVAEEFVRVLTAIRATPAKK